MAQFSLPQNSKIEVGNYFKDKTNSKNLRKINVYRWDPSTGKNPRIDTFEVDMDNCGPKVLDILFKIKNEIDPSLTFRRSCAHGVCGSCAMNIDGVNTLACIKSHTDINGDLNVYPLPHLKVVKDLIGDLTTLYKQYESIKPWLQIEQTGKEKEEIKQSQKDREKLDGYYECYNLDVTTHTLDTHIYRLRQKLEKNPSIPRLIISEGGGFKINQF